MLPPTDTSEYAPRPHIHHINDHPDAIPEVTYGDVYEALKNHYLSEDVVLDQCVLRQRLWQRCGHR